jgi:hypothetical protein
VVVQNNTQSMNLADNYAKTYETEFQTRLKEGLELGFMNDAVVKLAENFIRVIFAPIYKEIKFDNNSERAGALPLMEYLQKESEDSRRRKNELLEINESLILTNEKLGTEVIKIETEQSLDESIAEENSN